MSEQNNVRVLIVDDEEQFLMPILYWLKKQGYQVTSAESGERMLELLKNNEFDIVFLDINMKPMDGFECLEKAKKIKKDLPVVMLTAQVNELRQLKAEQLGADGFYYKGLANKHIINSINGILKRKKTDKPLNP